MMMEEFSKNQRQADVGHLPAEVATPKPTYAVGQYVRVSRSKGAGENRDEAVGQIMSADITDDGEWYDVKVPDGPHHKHLSKVLNSNPDYSHPYS